MSRETPRRTPYFVVAGVVAAGLSTAAFFAFRRTSASPETPTSAHAGSAGSGSALQATLPPVDASESIVHVSVETNPPGSHVYVKDEDRGAAPVSLAVPRGVHLDLRSSAAGFADAKMMLDAERDGEVVVLTLAPQQAASTVDAGIAHKPEPHRHGTASSLKPGAGSSSRAGFDPNEVGGD